MFLLTLMLWASHDTVRKYLLSKPLLCKWDKGWYMVCCRKSFPQVKLMTLCSCVLFRLAAAELFMLCWQGGRQIQLKKEKERRGLLTPCLRLQIKDLALDHASMASFVFREIFFLTDILSKLQLCWCFAVSNPSSCYWTLLITVRSLPQFNDLLSFKCFNNPFSLSSAAIINTSAV